MKLAVKTFGCKANSVDTDVLMQEALRRGYELVDESTTADAYVINSCTVTQHADRDARNQTLRYKRLNPSALVGVVGCYGQVAKEELLALPSVDFVVGTAEKLRILDYFEKVRSGTEVARDQVTLPTGFLETEFRGSRYARATVKIQDGCNFKCSFCIIPQARGRSRSLETEIVLRQIQQAEAQGFTEVVLTGIHLAHYGWDRNSDLVTLMEQILNRTDGPRVRLSTLDPFEIPDSLLALMDSPRFCPHFHIAIQSGSDKILKRMRRIYKADEFDDACARIKRRSPDAFIGVDVIVGFPGETENEFRETVACLERTPWSKLHVFSYSSRRGTEAANYTDRVASSRISARSEILRKLSEERHRQFLQSQIGKTKRVVLEREARKMLGFWQGHTENYIPVLLETKEGTPRREVPSQLLQVKGDQMIARLA